MQPFQFKLYISDHNKRSVAALENLRQLLKNQLLESYELEIIDVLLDSDRAAKDQILATPTLIYYFHDSVIRIIGDLSETEKLKSIFKF